MSTRARLTFSYALVLLGTMVVFAISLWKARQNLWKQELAQEASRVADRVLVVIQSAQQDGKRLTYVDSSDTANPLVRATRELGDVLDPVPGYFMVLDQQGKV